MFRSLPARDAQRVAVALKALTSKAAGAERAEGVDARGFLEARAGAYRVLYRRHRGALRVALLNHVDQARPREFPQFDLPSPG